MSRTSFSKSLIGINLSSHIYCLLKIEKEKEIILAVALPDSQKIVFFKINGIYNFHKIKELKCSDDKEKNYFSERKKIMTYLNNNLFVGCKNNILVINLINYEIEYRIRIYSQQITFTNIFLDRFLICGVTKEINRLLHESEGYLIQKDLIKHSKEKKTNLFTVSEYKNFKFKGNIINSKTCHINDKKIIISIGTDNQILILN